MGAGVSPGDELRAEEGVVAAAVQLPVRHPVEAAVRADGADEDLLVRGQVGLDLAAAECIFWSIWRMVMRGTHDDAQSSLVRGMVTKGKMRRGR